MIVAGIGCRRGTDADEIRAAITVVLESAGLSVAAIDYLATASRKADEPGIHAAADALGRSLVIVPDAALAAAPTLTRSPRVLAQTGVHSVAEAAALAAAGTGARLLGPRTIAGRAACALAATDIPE